MSARLDRSKNFGVTYTTPPPRGEVIVPPEVSPELIRYLQQVFPVKLDATNDLRAYDRMVGQHEVILHLAEVLDQQNSQD